MTLQEYLSQPTVVVSEFADKVSRDSSVVARWKRGETVPDWKLWTKIEEVTNGAVRATVSDFQTTQKDAAE